MSAALRRNRPAQRIKPAFLVGCTGSGTSVLATIIAAHPDVRSVEGPQGPWSSLPAGVDGSDRLTAQQAADHTAEWLRTWAAEHQDGAGLLLDHDARHSLRVPFLRTVFPEAKFVHVVRDGRDVARTLLPEVGGDQWLGPKPARWRELLEGTSGYLRCALAWREVVQTTLSDLEGTTHLFVRYEDLMERSEETGNRVLDHLELAQDAELHEAFARVAEIARALPNGQHFTVRRWRALAIKRPFELRAGNVLVADTLERLGYDPVPPELVPASNLRLPRSALLEQRRLARMVEERERRIADLERTAADLRRMNLAEREVADGLKGRLARAERRASGDIELLTAKLGELEARVAELAQPLSGERSDLQTRLSDLSSELAQSERARAELTEERDAARHERLRVQEELDEAFAALRRIATSRSWRLGHWVARAAGTLLLRKPGRDSALEVTLRRIDRRRAPADGADPSRGNEPSV